jgi:hypothetical protein
MGDFSLIHVQPEFQTAFEHTPTLLPDGFRLCFGAFDDEDKIIGIAAVRHRGVSTASFLTAVLRPRWILLFQYHRSFLAFPLR